MRYGKPGVILEIFEDGSALLWQFIALLLDYAIVVVREDRMETIHCDESVPHSRRAGETKEGLSFPRTLRFSLHSRPGRMNGSD